MDPNSVGCLDLVYNYCAGPLTGCRPAILQHMLGPVVTSFLKFKFKFLITHKSWQERCPRNIGNSRSLLRDPDVPVVVP